MTSASTLRPVALALVQHPPADAERHGDRPVVVNGEPWLLVASRRHPTTGVVNALLVSPDRQRAAVVPLDQVEQRPAVPAVEARLTPGEGIPRQVRTPGKAQRAQLDCEPSGQAPPAGAAADRKGGDRAAAPAVTLSVEAAAAALAGAFAGQVVDPAAALEETAGRWNRA